MIENDKNICDSNTFEAVFKAYSKDIKRFIFYKIQNIEKAEDIVQDTFVKLWKNCSKIDYTRVKSFLYTTANNTFLNYVKHEKVVLKHRSNITTTKNNESPEFIMLEKEFLEKINKTLENLPEKQREVFLLNRIEKKKYKEISEMLNISVKAVEKRMHRALLTVRNEIGNI